MPSERGRNAALFAICLILATLLAPALAEPIDYLGSHLLAMLGPVVTYLLTVVGAGV
jgi:hypothetical protein